MSTRKSFISVWTTLPRRWLGSTSQGPTPQTRTVGESTSPWQRPNQPSSVPQTAYWTSLASPAVRTNINSWPLWCQITNCLYLLLNILNYQNIEDFSIKALLNVTQYVSYIGGAIFVGQCDLGYYANQSSHSCQRCPSLDSGVIIPGDCIPCDSNLNTISCLSESLLTSPFPIYCGLVSQIVSKL